MKSMLWRLHQNEEYVQSLGLSVEARELLGCIDYYPRYVLAGLVGRWVTDDAYSRIEVNAESVREKFSRMACALLSVEPAFEKENRDLQTSYQQAIRSMLSSPDRSEVSRMVRLLIGQFDKEVPPARSISQVINI